VARDSVIVDWETGFIIVTRFDGAHAFCILRLGAFSLTRFAYKGIKLLLYSQLALIIGFLCHNK